ncbi:unnamed protein product [Staurois parvus]|uniref:Uncharacterized protein n=1 Tax=Staurois parvus TaxID=386267 RepID=A0ABN9H8B6_9NEOB|nr:unnamed protein product [Staurois parvus]
MLPTLRKMEVDSVGHKLSEEHSRSSTPCECTFLSELLSPGRPSCNYDLLSQQVTDTGREVSRQYRSRSMGHIEIPGVTPGDGLSLTQAAIDWSRCVSSCGEFQLRDLKRHGE